MPTRKSTASANRKAKAALAAATEAARKRLGLETLATRGRDALGHRRSRTVRERLSR